MLFPTKALMRHRLLVIPFTILAVITARADPTTNPTAQPKQVDRISTSDFDISLPHGWRAIPSESKDGVVVFQSADGNARLTISIALDSAPPGPRDGNTKFAQISEVRRQTEIKLAPKILLTPYESTGKDGVWSSTWRGIDSGTGRKTATLVQLAKSKLLIFYVEAFDTSETAVDELATQVFGSVAAK